MASSDPRPDSASTVQGSMQDNKVGNDGGGEKEDGAPLAILATQQDEPDGEDRSIEGGRARKQVERKPTYVKEFWKFHLRGTDDDEQKYLPPIGGCYGPRLC